MPSTSSSAEIGKVPMLRIALAFFLLFALGAGPAHSGQYQRTKALVRTSPFRHALLPERLRTLGDPRPYVDTSRIGQGARGGALKMTITDVGGSSRSRSVTGTSADSAGLTWARRFSSGRVASTDYPDDLAVDHEGNIYVAGLSQGLASDGDGLVLKYSPRGDLLWQARYVNAYSGYAELRAIALDSLGNLYAAGFTTDDHGHYQMLAVKYDSTGTELWHRTYQSRADSDDVGVDIVVDTTGTSYLLGSTYQPGAGYDMLLISYSPSGEVNWSQEFDGGSLIDDHPSSLKIRRDGELILTGTAGIDAVTTGMLTIACTSGGGLAWRSLYHPDQSVVPTAMSVDDSGFVSVGGVLSVSDSVHSTVVARYSPTGALVWLSSYTGVYAGSKTLTGITSDRQGNICVAATIMRTSVDYLTLKYDRASGSLLWEKVFDNSYHGDDYATGIAVSTEGYIYVSGFSRYTVNVPYDFLTVEMDSTGRAIEAVRHEQGGTSALTTAIVPDNNGNVFVAGAVLLNNLDIAVVKYASHQTGEWVIDGDIGSHDDSVGALAADRAGNSYVAVSDGQAMSVIKYDITSRLVWQTPITGFTGMHAAAVVLDTNGNAYVVGSALNVRGNTDILVARFSPQGAIAWAKTVDGPDGLDDAGVTAVVDASGNCIAVCTSTGLLTKKDILTLKYAPSGDLLWSSRYNYPFNRDDIPTSVALDSHQSIYITGSSIRPSTTNDVLTLKYDKNGIFQWVSFYDGPGSGADIGKAIVVSKSDTVFVAAKSYGAATSTDVALLRYSPLGQLAWAARYDGGSGVDEEPTDIAADSNGNIVISGIAYHGNSSFDFLTLKYDKAGNLLWQHLYDGPSHGNDLSLALAVDRYNGIIITGTSLGLGSGNDIVTIRYTEDGFLDWLQRYDGNASLNEQATSLALDGLGNVFVGGSSQSDTTGTDYLLLKYSAPRVESWPALYDGPGTSGDAARALTVDRQGNIYLAGQSEASGFATSLLSLRYSADGTFAWSSLYPPSGNVFDNARDILVDPGGAPIMTGMHQSGSTTTVYATIKYTPDGSTSWMAAYAGEYNSYNFPVAMGADSRGVVVTGYGYSTATSYDFATVRYDTGGKVAWTARYDDPASDNDLATALVLDTSGNAYVTGMTGTGAQSVNFTTIKYDLHGAVRWKSVFDGPDHRDDRPGAIARDSAGHIVVTGWTDRFASEHDFATVKYDTDGTPLWTRYYNGPGNNRDEPGSVAIDSGGNVYVAGTSYGQTFTNPDVVLIKYAPSGSVVWSRRFDGDNGSDDILGKMILDRRGNVYLTVGTTTTAGKGEIFTLSYDSAGSLRWSQLWQENGTIQAEPSGLALDVDGNVIVTGTSAGNSWKAITTLKYHQGPSAGVADRLPIPAGFALSQNYPNPFNNATKLSYELPGRSHVKLGVFNLLGQEVAVLFDGIQTAGRFETVFNADRYSSGVYFCMMKAELLKNSSQSASAFVTTRKLILAK